MFLLRKKMTMKTIMMNHVIQTPLWSVKNMPPAYISHSSFVSEDKHFIPRHGKTRQKTSWVRWKRESLCTSCSFSVTLYVLFFIGFANPKTDVVTVSNISPSLFAQLRLEHEESLSCLCTNSSMPYKTFVSSTISFHPVCSSVFVSKPWIEALHLHNASAYLIMDFRTTASSQVSWYEYSMESLYLLHLHAHLT